MPQYSDDVSFDHDSVTGYCAGACHEYTSSNMTTIKDFRSGEHRTTEEDFYLMVTGNFRQTPPSA